MGLKKKNILTWKAQEVRRVGKRPWERDRYIISVLYIELLEEYRRLMKNAGM